MACFLASFYKSRLFLSKDFQRFLWRFCGFQRVTREKIQSVRLQIFSVRENFERSTSSGNGKANVRLSDKKPHGPETGEGRTRAGNISPSRVLAGVAQGPGTCRG